MPYWVIADVDGHKRGMLGPYVLEERAEEVKEGIEDGHAKVYQTQSYNRKKASQEIRHDRVEEEGLGEGFKNFRHKGVDKQD